MGSRELSKSRIGSPNEESSKFFSSFLQVQFNKKPAIACGFFVNQHYF